MELKEQLIEDLSSIVDFKKYTQIANDTLDGLFELITAIETSCKPEKELKSYYDSTSGEEIDYTIKVYSVMSKLLIVEAGGITRYLAPAKLVKFLSVQSNESLNSIIASIKAYSESKSSLESIKIL